MKNVVLNCDYAWTNDNAIALYHHMAFIPNDIYVLTTSKKYTEYSFAKNRPFYDFYVDLMDPEVASKKNVWRDVWNEMDVTPFQDVDNIFVMNPPIYEITKISDSINKVVENLLDGFRGLRFNHHYNAISKYLIAVKASIIYKIPFYQYSFEASSIDISLNKEICPFEFHNYHGYNYRHLTHLSSLQRWYHDNPAEKLEKKYDMVFAHFYMPNITDVRKKSVEHFMDSVVPNFSNNFVYCKEPGGKFIERTEYMRMIAESKYSYIVNSYIPDLFSIDRFIDCIAHDCLPLIGSSVNTKDVNETFGVDLDILKRDTPFEESERIRILEELKQKMLFIDNIPEIKEREGKIVKKKNWFC